MREFMADLKRRTASIASDCKVQRTTWNVLSDTKPVEFDPGLRDLLEESANVIWVSRRSPWRPAPVMTQPSCPASHRVQWYLSRAGKAAATRRKNGRSPKRLPPAQQQSMKRFYDLTVLRRARSENR